MQSISSVRIAMWSGPRNISTAMMRAWENRSDCAVWDEPLYGHYLFKTGIAHPGAKQVIEAQGIDWRNIVERCIANPPNEKRIYYQKHMTLHLLPEIDRQWLSSLTNCFLIREPEPVIASYAAVREDVSLDDIGFVQQAELFEYVTQKSGTIPMVIDSREFLLNPEAMLRKICIRLDLEFEASMLSWPTGARESDGVWGKYWYDSVWNSSGFAPWREKPLNLDLKQQAMADQARPYYDQLYQHRLL
jgi:hypothetical protein